MTNIEVDFSKVLLSDYLDFMMSDFSLPIVLIFMDKAVVGGIMDRPMTEYPAVAAKIIKALNEEIDTINLAIRSMSRFMTGDHEDDWEKQDN